MITAIDGSLLGARFSGVERSVGQLLAHLPQTSGDHQFIIFVGDRFDDYVRRYHPDGFPTGDRLTIVRGGFDNRRRATRISWQQLVLPRLAHQSGAEVFHGPAYLAPASIRMPHVVTVYDLFALDQPQLCTWSNRIHYGLLQPAGIVGAQRVLVPSAATRRVLAHRLPQAYDRCEIVPLGVAPQFAREPANLDEVRDLYRLPAHYLLWVGNVEPKKNVGFLLRVLQRLQQQGREVPPLVLAGALSWGANELMRQYLASGLQSQVRLLGAVPDEHLPAVYRGAGAFCFPSLAEGFGLPPLEAMASGVPVLTSDAGALPEVVGSAGLVLPLDVDQWADAVERLLGDTELRAGLIARGRSRSAGFTWDRTATLTVQAYEQAAQLGEDEYDPRTGRFVSVVG